MDTFSHEADVGKFILPGNAPDVLRGHFFTRTPYRRFERRETKRDIQRPQKKRRRITPSPQIFPYFSFSKLLAGGKNRLLSEIKQLPRRNTQHLAQLEDHIEGYAHVAQLDRADVTAVDVDQLSQLELGHFSSFTIVHHIQAELFV